MKKRRALLKKVAMRRRSPARAPQAGALAQALAFQRASDEVLSAIAASQGDATPVFEAILRNIARLTHSEHVAVQLLRDGQVHLVAFRGEGAADEVRKIYPQPLDDLSTTGLAMRRRKVVQFAPLSGNPRVPARTAALSRKVGYESMLATPMMLGRRVIGAIATARRLAMPFPPHEAALMKRFADQAAIAIENARLFNETREALERQTATADVLKVINASPTDTGPVFEAIVRSFVQLSGSVFGSIVRFDGELVHFVAAHGLTTAQTEQIARKYPVKAADASVASARAILTRAPVHIDDIAADQAYDRSHNAALKIRRMLAVPMLREGKPLGAIVAGWPEPGATPTAHDQLLRTFADQAAIALDNARLFNETKEALERQTATAEILKVISNSPTNVQPVFDAIAHSAVTLCGGTFAAVCRYDGEVAYFVAHHGFSPAALKLMQERFPRKPEGLMAASFAARDVVHAPDALKDQRTVNPQLAHTLGYRAFLGVPMMRGGRPIGIIIIFRREPGPFSDSHIAVVRAFADQAAIAIENVRLFNETKQALEQQTAISEVLEVISGSPTEVAPVLNAVAARSAKICEASDARIFLVEGNCIRGAAGFGDMPLTEQVLPLDRGAVSARAVLDGVPVHVPDIRAEPAHEYPISNRIAEASGWRTMLSVPLMREKKPLGVILLRRREVRPFNDKHIALLKTFADQAAIAIENVRLFNETKEALERQTATAEILRVISSSPSDVQPVFDAIVQSALRLIGGLSAMVTRIVGDEVHIAAFTSLSPETDEFIRSRYPIRLGDSTAGRAIAARAPYVVSDTQKDDLPAATREITRVRGYRSMLVAPMFRDGVAIGTLHISRREPGAFTDHQVELIKTFADQAVIAIENVRLFNRTKEALERQTATSEILSVISGSPSDVQPAFDAIAKSAMRLLGGRSAAVTRLDGETLHLAAHTATTASGDEVLRQMFPMPLPKVAGVLRKVFDSAAPAYTEDTETGYNEEFRNMARARGHRSVLAVPMMRDGVVIGVISVTRTDPGKFSDHETGLLKTFADQAVIAIENVRLFNETKEALEQQTATAEILKVISSSPTDTQPVFEAIVRSGLGLFPNAAVAVVLPRGKEMHLAAVATQDPAQAATWRERFQTPLSRERIHGAAILDCRLIDIPDAEAEVDGPMAVGVRNFLTSGNRAVTVMPMICGDAAIGAISVIRAVPGPLTDKQLSLLRTFASQAVIAIENVRLFNETKEALERQTATAEILKVIAGSPSDTRPVFKAIVDAGRALFPDAAVAVTLRSGDVVKAAAIAEASDMPTEQWQAKFPFPLTHDYMHGAAILDRRLVDIPDATAPDAERAFGPGIRNFLGSGYRAVTIMPMVRGDSAFGTVTVLRKSAGPLSGKQVEILRTFADQAVIAIENVRLFNETKEALERQTATGEILSSMSSAISNAQPVFDTIVRNLRRLFDTPYAVLSLIENGQCVLKALAGDERFTEEVKRAYPWAVGDETMLATRALRTGQVVQLAPLRGSTQIPARTALLAAANEYDSILIAPLMRDGVAMGFIVTTRTKAVPFDDKQVALVKSFADQAVIAIENVRLFNETKEALEQQKASAEVLGVISSSIADTKPVFNRILESCVRLFGVKVGGITTVGEDGKLHLEAYLGPDYAQFERALFPMPLDANSGNSLALLDRRILHIPDSQAEGVPPGARRGHLATQTRASLFAPMVWEDRGIGTIFVSREAPGPYSDKEIALLKTFADQAAIAIQNAKLFREIQEKSAQLQIANQHKSEFLANMSHELRTPLNAIIGFSEVLSEKLFGEVNEKQDEYLKDIHSSGQHLLSLINDILDLSKIEAGRMELDLARFDLGLALENALTLVRERATRAGISLTLDAEGVEEWVADERKVKQVLLNLLSNAVKFTPQGGAVKVRARRENGAMEIAVADTGVGIAAADQEAVFEEFRQVGRDYLKKAEGTGLGLALTKRFVELHGGTLRLQSAPGKGSIFSFTLPERSLPQ